jgi:hypothetical protein
MVSSARNRAGPAFALSRSAARIAAFFNDGDKLHSISRLEQYVPPTCSANIFEPNVQSSRSTRHFRSLACWGEQPENNLAGGNKMSTLPIIVILLLLFGGGGGYYAFNTYGGVGLGGVLGTVLLILVILWIVGALR